jgi:predicted Zn-dependent protease
MNIFRARNKFHGLVSALLLSASLVGAGFFAEPALAKNEPARKYDGVPTPKKSRALGLVNADKIEAQAAQQYEQLKRQAASQRALAPDDYPQLIRIRAIADKLIPFAIQFADRYVDEKNPVNRAKSWKWEVSLIASKQINAFCMPGGKIAFYTGIIDTLQLNDDEIAQIMGHEIAHAILEHGRERAAKQTGAQVATIGAAVLSSIFGLGDLGGQVASGVAQVTMLKYGRTDELESDMVGMDIAARAGYDPRAGMALWKKMAAVSKGAPPEFMSTHPSHTTRIKDIEAHLPETLPLFGRAAKKDIYALPPYETNWQGKRVTVQ